MSGQQQQQQQQQQQNIFTIHESQLNTSAGDANGDGAHQQRTSQSDILIDTSSIPLTQQSMPPMQHHQHSLQPQNVSQFDGTITSQPIQGTSSSSSAQVAPENQNVTYSVHPVFSLLDQHDTLLVRQRADCTSTCCGFESSNTYTVRAKDGTKILKAIENSNCCERCCFETNREYNLSLVHGDEVVARISKSYRISRFCCYTNAARIESPPDNPIGFIKQQMTLFGHTKYAIYDCQQPPKQASFLLESTSCRFCCTPLLCTCVCANKEFRIVDTETRDEVGRIVRSLTPEQEEGQNSFASPDCQLFGIQFEANLEARHKVLLLAACFMMDFFYFENDRRRRKLASC